MHCTQFCALLAKIFLLIFFHLSNVYGLYVLVVLCGFPPKELCFYADNCCLKDTGIRTGENIIVEELDEPYPRHHSERDERSELEKQQGFTNTSSGQKLPDSDEVIFVREEKQASVENFSTRRPVVGMHSNRQLMRKLILCCCSHYITIYRQAWSFALFSFLLFILE